MKGVAAFIADTIGRGLLVVLPILLLWLVFKQAFAVVSRVTTPILHLLPKDVFPDTEFNRETAALLVLLVGSSVLGLLRAESSSANETAPG